MHWIILLLLATFPNLPEFNEPRETARWVLTSGEFGSPDEVVRAAKEEVKESER